MPRTRYVPGSLQASGLAPRAMASVGDEFRRLAGSLPYPHYQDLGTVTAATTLKPQNATLVRVTLGASVALTIDVTGVGDGEPFMLRLTQDGTGSRTVSSWTNVTWMDGLTPTLSTAAGANDYFAFVKIGTSWIGRVLFTKNWAFGGALSVASGITNTQSANSGVNGLTLSNPNTGNAASSVLRFSTSISADHVWISAYGASHATLAQVLDINNRASKVRILAGNVLIATFDTTGRLTINSMPTSSAGLPAGTLWNNSGVVNVA